MVVDPLLSCQRDGDHLCYRFLREGGDRFLHPLDLLLGNRRASTTGGSDHNFLLVNCSASLYWVDGGGDHLIDYGLAVLVRHANRQTG
jgi:hypothetical protein